MKVVKELLAQKSNVSEQLSLLRKNRDKIEVQDYIKDLESRQYLSDYMRYMIERYYYGNRNAVKAEKNCVERFHKVLLK